MSRSLQLPPNHVAPPSHRADTQLLHIPSLHFQPRFSVVILFPRLPAVLPSDDTTALSYSLGFMFHVHFHVRSSFRCGNRLYITIFYQCTARFACLFLLYNRIRPHIKQVNVMNMFFSSFLSRAPQRSDATQSSQSMSECYKG